jgi:hypothetical protein
MLFLQIMHIVVFLCISLVNYIDCRDLHAHYSSLLKLLSVVAYTGLILNAQDALIRVKLMLEGEGKICDPVDLGSVSEGLIMEITGFYVNILISIALLLASYTPFKVNANTKIVQKLRLDRMMRYIQIRQYNRQTEAKDPMENLDRDKVIFPWIKDEDGA